MVLTVTNVRTKITSQIVAICDSPIPSVITKNPDGTHDWYRPMDLRSKGDRSEWFYTGRLTD